jgi:hypothetical protein
MSARVNVPLGVQPTTEREALPRHAWACRILLVIGVALAATGQWILVTLPKGLHLPRWLADAARPMWPQPEAAVWAVGCFILAMVCFGLASRYLRLAPALPALDVHLTGLQRPYWLSLALGAVGLGIFAGLLFCLGNRPYSPSYPPWLALALALFLAALIANERRSLPVPRGMRSEHLWEVAGVLALAAVFLWLSIFDLHSWYYFSLGDEHGFYEAAMQMATGNSPRNLFDQKGAFDVIPVMSSYWSGVLMRLFFGMNGIGWKEAIIIPAAVALVVTYLLARALYGRRVAVLTLGALVTSHYLLAYAHTGYNNLEPLLPNGLALLLFLGGIRRGSPLLLALSGVCAGLGWYTYYPSRTTIFILLAAVALTVRRGRWLPVGAVILAGFATLLLPFLVVNKTAILMRMLEQTGVGPTPEHAANRALLPLWNTGRSLLAFNYNTHLGPYLYGSLAEPVTAALLPLGLAYVLATWRDFRSRFVFVWWGLAIAATGVLSKYDYVSTSRLNFLMPVVALLAALAVDRTIATFEVPTSARWRRVMTLGGVGLVLAAVSWGNLHRWFVETRAHAPSSPQTLTMRAMERPECLNASLPPLIVDVGIGGSTDIALVARGSRVRPKYALYADPPTWIESAPQRCVIFRAPFDPDAQELARALEARWPQAHSVFEVDQAGVIRVRVYYPTAQP